MALDYITYSRTLSVTVDKFGVDPLKDKALDRISAIVDYDLYLVKQQDSGRPDNISHAKYGNPNFWWIIMAYNGIMNFRDIQAGVTLRIPLMSQVLRIMSDITGKNYANRVRTVVI